MPKCKNFGEHLYDFYIIQDTNLIQTTITSSTALFKVQIPTIKHTLFQCPSLHSITLSISVLYERYG